ncbi:hypothetical protein PHYPSEUDO_006303 [Phytophthora pseudosyringae]|uniref:Carbohydrate kinase PfkB domain-containing protein n=1 Tax=Phytophthora pseudosyringae TaxID=221518 RepID=A0A8T1VIX8_9STRA|nr:hypothetical protein PHYPSEUDO_006303 [Phytophthora pseudosyringae]
MEPMMEVIGVGIAVIDVIHEVAAYPEGEDSKTRSLASRKCRGGNVANALCVCAQLGSRCRWLGVSTDPAHDSDAAFVHADLSAFGVDCSLASIEDKGSMPISYILSSRATGSRTIVNSRNLAELSYEAFVKQLTLYRETNQEDANKPVWLHFEGRNLEEVERMMLFLRGSRPAAKISVEVESLRNDWGSAMKLISLADYAFISKDYVREKLGFQSAEQFFKDVAAEQWGSELTHHAKAFICPWGAEGVYYLDVPGSEMHQVPATRLDKVVETIGAGDSFIGASLAGFARGNLPFDVVLKTACEVASAKCSKHGFALPAENRTTWRKTFRGEGGSVGAYVA